MKTRFLLLAAIAIIVGASCNKSKVVNPSTANNVNPSSLAGVATIEGRYVEGSNGSWCCDPGKLCMVVVTPNTVNLTGPNTYDIEPESGYSSLSVDLYIDNDEENPTREVFSVIHCDNSSGKTYYTGE